MGYEKDNGRYARTRAVDLVAGAEYNDPAPAATAVTKTATANGPALELGDVNDLRLTLNVTAHAGTTPSYTFTLSGDAV